ncbi:MAG: hypothetical protein WC953_06625 [Pseudomonas sp.]
MGFVRYSRNAVFGLTLLLTPMLASAQQAINPAVFAALNTAQKAQQSGDLAQARSTLNGALDKASAGSLELALIQQRLGYIAISAEQYPQAIEWLNKALAHDQLDAETARQDRLNLAQLLAAQGRYADAAGLLERERRNASLTLEQTQLLVQCYSRLRDYAKAIPLAEQVVKVNAAADDVWYQLLVGMSYEQGQYARAAQWQKVLLKRNPNKAEHWRQLAGLQSQAGEQRAAAATLRLAHEGGFGLTQTDLDNLVALQVNAGAPWQAARLLEELIGQRLLAADAARRERLAQLWTSARDRNRAREAWAALANGSNRSDHWLRLAGMQLEDGDWSELLATLKRAQNGASSQQRQLIRQWEDYARSAIESSSQG